MSKATRIFRNATVLSMDSAARVAQAIAIEGDRILALGNNDEIMAFKGNGTEIIDLGGATVLPGFIDGHSHFMTTAEMYGTQLNLASPPVGSMRTIDDILELVRERAAQTPKGQFIMGFGYDDTLLAEKRHPTASDIDKAAPDHPVMLKHVSGHVYTCNSLALKMGNITRHTPDPVGGKIRHDADGEPNGVLEERPAFISVLEKVPPLDDAQWKHCIEVASRAYTAKGVTTAQEGFCTDLYWEKLTWAHEMANSPLWPRVQLLPGYGRMKDVNRFNTTKSGTQFTADHMLSMGAVKMLADGSLQAYTGYLSNPYHKIIYDLPDGALWRGYPIQPALDLQEIIWGLHRNGWQIAVHGNGDAAIQDILDAFEEANRRYPRADARHIIIHCQTVREDQLDRIKRLGLLISFFATHTYYWGDRHYSTFLGEDRAERIDPLRSALVRGITFSTHNDTYVTPIDPLLSVWSAATRITSGGRVLGADQRVPVMAALRSVTSWAAYQACEEDLKGSLEPGKLADMVVLEQNPLAIAPEALRDIPIRATLVGGREVFGTL